MTAAWLLAMNLAAADPAATLSRVPGTADCEQRAEQGASDTALAWCYVDAAELRLEPAAPIFEQLERLEPTPEVRLARAHLLRVSRDPRALDLLEALVDEPDPTIASRATVELVRWHLDRDDHPKAAEVLQARTSAGPLGSALAAAELELARGQVELAALRPELAYRIARRLETEMLPHRQRDAVLMLRAAAAHDSGRLALAFDLALRARDDAEAVGDLRGEARAHFMLMSVLSNAPDLRRRLGAEELEALEEAALRSTERWNEGARAMMGCLVGPSRGLGRGEALLRGCVQWMRNHDLLEHVSVESLSTLAIMRLSEDRDEAFALSDEALEIVRRVGHPLPWSIVAFHRAWMCFEVGEVEEGIRHALEAITAVERVREREVSESAQSRAQVQWATPSHHLVSQYLFGFDPPRIDEALALIGRLRGAAMLQAMRIAAIDSAPEIEAARAGYLTALDARETTDTPEARAVAEREIAERSDALARARAHALGEHPREPIGLAALQEALDERTAILLFQLARPDPSIRWLFPELRLPSFVLVVHRDGARVFPLGDADALEAEVGIATDLLRQGAAPEDLSASLHRRLLDDALAVLPPRVERLVLVPDGALHGLPFAALRAHPEAPVLVERFSLSTVPSIEIWLQLREREADGRGVLVFADPTLGATARIGASPAAPLPGTREEARAIVQTWGSGVVLHQGADASEATLHTESLRDHAVLHFATHAIVDAQHPDASAVVLAGTPGHDGLLTPPEIAKLDLRGQVIVLSACSSAGGETLPGEGVLGLVRAFFLAGAKTVVATPWPIHDGHAARLFAAFHRHLSRGLAVDEALAAAQRERIAAGVPVGEWAAMVLGDGSAVPFPRRPRSSAWPWILGGLSLLLVSAMVWWWRLVRRRAVASHSPAR